MSAYNPPQQGHPNPADQPKAPGNGDTCGDLAETTPPTLDPPTPCPDPDPDCKCPSTPGNSPSCLEDLIEKQGADIAAAEKAKTFKADLEALLAKAKIAGQDYTRDKYEALIKTWVQRDTDIAELIRKLV